MHNKICKSLIIKFLITSSIVAYIVTVLFLGFVYYTEYSTHILLPLDCGLRNSASVKNFPHAETIVKI